MSDDDKLLEQRARALFDLCLERYCDGELSAGEHDALWAFAQEDAAATIAAEREAGLVTVPRELLTELEREIARLREALAAMALDNTSIAAKLQTSGDAAERLLRELGHD